MGRAWFDVEYTDAALDQARRKAQQSGGDVPARKSHESTRLIVPVAVKAKTLPLLTLL